MIVKLLDMLVRHGAVLKWATLGFMLTLVIIDLILPSAYDRFVWETWGGFGAFFGIVASLILILLAKGLGFGLVYRSEDYYDEELKGREMSGDPRAEDEEKDTLNREENNHA
ncbi:hypothetical protein J2T60_001033 [Natronospira proteinivora]|uniref:Uncharacterized protein n=1 Tax=Natronospira proteinivora TaxID=1807133 RepID=A0ABT1G9S0_9GAMM|nr:hypothetical protein [Natronospira proteinivora]MCP1727068.1 hypothetical protein [Natronospira proteinivora]